MASAHGSRPQDGAQDFLEPAWRMRWRVPELALMLSDRAVAQARRTGDRGLRLRAESVAVFASNRLGHGVSATGRAIAGVRDAEAAGQEDVAAQLRVELACCARCAGSHEVALRVLYPVLERECVDPTVRAHALIELAAALPAGSRDVERGDALDEAERLYTSAAELNRDTHRLLRARVCGARAAHYRRHAEFPAAVEAAGTGLDLLDHLGDPDSESGEIRAHLVLERVQALLELGRHGEAADVAHPVLAEPVRAASAAPSGWLRLALATRLHLADEQHGDAIKLLNEAVAAAERHRLDELLAEALGTSSHVHEKCADFPEALRCLRSAHAADRRWRSVVHAARIKLLEEFPSLSEVTVPTQQTRSTRRTDGYLPPPQRSSGGETAEPAGSLRDFPTDRVDESAGANRPATHEFPAESAVAGFADVAGLRDSVFEDAVSGVIASGVTTSDAPSASGSATWPEDVLTGASGSGQDDPWSASSWPLDLGFPGETGETGEADGTPSPEISSPESLIDGPDRGRDRDTADVRTPAPAQGRPNHDRGEPDRRPSWERPSRAGVDRGEAERPDVTAIMPVIPGASSSFEDRWPDVDQQGTPTYDATRLATDPLQADPDPLEPDVAQGASWPADSPPEVVEPPPSAEARSWVAEPWSRSPSGAAASADPELSREWPPSSESETSSEAGSTWGPRTSGGARSPHGPGPSADPSPAAEPTSSGRRTRGRSLADIQESLRVLRERSRRRDPEPEDGGRRRARHAEPEPEEPAESQPVEEFLARYRDAVPEQPTSRDERPPRADGEPAATPEAEPTSSGSAGLADLLAEALLAYEDGRRGVAEDDPEFGGRHGGPNVAGITGQHSGERHRQSIPDTEAPARHRRAAVDPAPFGSRTRTPPSY